jgi:formylglycine-generating enzyme required for sulfatase activity
VSWNYGVDNVSVSSSIELQVFALEMVYVTEGAFYAGDNATASAALKQGSSDTDSWRIGGEEALSVTNSSGNGSATGTNASLYYYPGTGDGSGDAAGSAFTLASSYPKGFGGFYIMKGEISQGQWVTFFNTLTSAQQTARDVTSSSNGGKNTDSLSNRNNVSWSGGDATLPEQGGGSTYEHGAMNYLSWADVAAYLDWTGLRPVSELELEKAGRGPTSAVSGEYS